MTNKIKKMKNRSETGGSNIGCSYSVWPCKYCYISLGHLQETLQMIATRRLLNASANSGYQAVAKVHNIYTQKLPINCIISSTYNQTNGN